jgi:hypothetical protein
MSKMLKFSKGVHFVLVSTFRNLEYLCSLADRTYVRLTSCEVYFVRCPRCNLVDGIHQM